VINRNSETLKNISNPLAHHLRAKQWQIALTYALNLFENIIELLYPLLIGLTINGLLTSSYDELILLITVWLTHTVIAGLRQLYDTRLFAKIFADIASLMAINLRAKGRDTGEVSAQVDMAREYIEFFEIEIPALLTIIISLIGSIVMLSYYDLIAAIIICAFIVPVGCINYWLARRSVTLNKSINNLQEKQVHRISLNRNYRIKSHFNLVAKWRVRLSNADAISWSAAEIITLVAFVLVLMRLIEMPNANIGIIFASVAYLIRIIDDLDLIPDAVQQIGRLIDIRRRIDKQTI